MAEEKQPIPADITLDRTEHELRILWRDELQSSYPLDALREACPCATCRGGHEFMGPAHDPNLIELKPVRSYQVENVAIVGNYALQIWWSDGHNTGIYSFGYLRRISPQQPTKAD
ncbi:MAG: DUF971 domain-containing protein [Chloroflexi bacterium]|nr:DUF971 domain-containing protein [Chloroflexota bacterium]